MAGRVVGESKEAGGVSRFAEVIVIARDADEVMKPLTRSDDNREWWQCFKPVYERYFEGPNSRTDEACFMWVIQFWRFNWKGLLSHLESLPWPDPCSVQVLVHDEEDDCFGLWMIYDGKLVEVSIPRAVRSEFPESSVTGVLLRTDRNV